MKPGLTGIFAKALLEAIMGTAKLFCNVKKQKGNMEMLPEQTHLVLHQLSSSSKKIPFQV